MVTNFFFLFFLSQLVVLLIPDMFIQEDVLKLCEVLLDRIGVSSVLLLQESLAASFGNLFFQFVFFCFLSNFSL